MATTTVVRTVPLDRHRAAELIADFTTSAEWDPGVASARRLDDASDLEAGARFHVDFRAGGLTLPLVYELTTYVPGALVVLETRGRWHHGRDDVRLVPAETGGTRIEWRATFGLRGPGRLVDPLLGRGFRRVAAHAGDGLAAFLARAAADHAG
jgi:hypothetical protein